MLAAVAVPNTLEVFSTEAVDDAHCGLMVSSAQLSDLCQEPLTDLGMAKITQLIAQVSDDLARTVEARKASSV